jgi:hypothetical protein
VGDGFSRQAGLKIQRTKTLHLPLMKQQDTREKLPTDVAALQKELAQERLRNKLLFAIIDIAKEKSKESILPMHRLKLRFVSL